MNNVAEFPIDGPRDPAPLAETRPLFWAIRREVWEHRAVVIAPIIVAAVVLFGTFIALVSMPHRLRAVPTSDIARRSDVLIAPLCSAPAPIMLATFLIALFYSFEALYGERRDRSILFWKSLPVSDATTVLSKAAIPHVVLPMIALVLSIVIQVILLVLSVPVLLGNRINPATLFAEFGFFEGILIMVYGLTAHALWFSPIYCWFILVSAWAKRAPLLLAVLPMILLLVLERVAFGTMYFARFLGYRVTGAMKEAFTRMPSGPRGISRLTELDPISFLTAPGLWMGLVFAGACLAFATLVRRRREPM
jgi:ABC-2 type transport system permease protein